MSYRDNCAPEKKTGRGGGEKPECYTVTVFHPFYSHIQSAHVTHLNRALNFMPDFVTLCYCAVTRRCDVAMSPALLVLVVLVLLPSLLPLLSPPAICDVCAAGAMEIIFLYSQCARARARATNDISRVCFCAWAFSVDAHQGTHKQSASAAVAAAASAAEDD